MKNNGERSLRGKALECDSSRCEIMARRSPQLMCAGLKDKHSPDKRTEPGSILGRTTTGTVAQWAERRLHMPEDVRS